MKKGFNKKMIFFLVLSFIILIGIDIFSKDDDSYKKEQEYIRSLNLNLKGTVIDVYQLKYGHDCGIISISISQSSIDQLDERNNRKQFLGIINDDKAEIVICSISKFRISDSIEINSDTYNLYRNGIEVIENNIITLPSDMIYEPYKEINKRLTEMQIE